MSEMEQVVNNIVKEYFNTAVIIDDQLEPIIDIGEAIEEIMDDDIAEVELYDGNQELIAVTNEANLDDYVSEANEAFNEFVKEGFVTLPIKFNINYSLSYLLNPIKNSRLLILDWNLEDTKNPDEMGKKAVEILDLFSNVKTGLRCSVIYTREDLDEVRVKIETEYYCREIKESEIIYFEHKEQNGGSSFFGFIMSKNIQASNIISEISKILIEDKSITLHLMESSNYLNQNLNKSIKYFNAPFEKVLFTQMISSEISDTNVSEFINDKLLKNVFEGHYKNRETSPHNFIYLNKRNKLLQKLKDNIHIDQVNEILAMLSITKKQHKSIISDYITTEKKQSLYELLLDANTLDFFIGKLKRIIALDYHIQEDKILQIFNPFLIFIMVLADYTNKEEYKESFYKQTVYFTKLLKFIDFDDREIKTGSIIKRDDVTYLLCITPVCDVARIQNIDNKLKFIVGEIKNEVDANQLKNNSDKYYTMALPIDDELKYIRWNFYNSITITYNEANENTYINTLNREYTQSLINKYISYQSRAGIEEIYYKESNYINNFIELIKP